MQRLVSDMFETCEVYKKPDFFDECVTGWDPGLPRHARKQDFTLPGNGLRA